MKKHIYSNLVSDTHLPQVVSLLLLTLAVSIIFISGACITQNKKTSNTPFARSLSLRRQGDMFALGVYKPYLVRIVDGNFILTTTTVHSDSESIIADTGIHLGKEDVFTIDDTGLDNEPFVGYEIVINRATTVSVDLYGKTLRLATQSNTVEELIDENNIVLGENDVITPALSTQLTNNLRVSIHEVGTKIITLEESLKFKKNYIDNAGLNYGINKIKTHGVNGSAEITYKITYNDGVEVSRLKIRTKIIQKPIDELVIRGTKGKPVSKGPLSPEQIHFLGNCEAGMDPTRNNGNGYYGAFQFSAGTWNSMGTGYARADLAPLNIQIQAVQQLLSRSSIYSQFPGCARQMASIGLL